LQYSLDKPEQRRQCAMYSSAGQRLIYATDCDLALMAPWQSIAIYYSAPLCK